MGRNNIRDIHNAYLREPDVATEYLNEAFSSGNQAAKLMAIRNIVEAQVDSVAIVKEVKSLIKIITQ